MIQKIKCWLGFHDWDYDEPYNHDNAKFKFFICKGCKEGRTMRVKA